MNPYQKLVDLIAPTRLAAPVFRTLANAIDKRLLVWTKGRVSSGIGTKYGKNIVLLTTTGAKTGEQRTAPVLHTPRGEEIILIASNAGEPKNPAWYHNLKKTPRCEVEKRGVRRAYEARELEGAERDEIFRAAVENYPGYAEYEKRAGRRIPVLKLSPL
jgi:deazaflavin-dependent oxidoreductase (nitroreductase family)